MTDIVFLDTETLGLNPRAPIWEFAAIRCSPGRIVQTREFFIEHEPHRIPDKGTWLDDMPAAFAADYQARYDHSAALDEATAAEQIHFITNGATIVGAVPSFDTERLAMLLRRNGIEPAWHYQILDVEALVCGHLAGRGTAILPPPWNSNQLSTAIGVDPNRFARHTAMGDVRWCQALYHAAMGGSPPKSDGVVIRLFLDGNPIANLGVDDYTDGGFSLPLTHPRADWLRQNMHRPGLTLFVAADDDPERYVTTLDWSMTGPDPRVRIRTTSRRARVRSSLMPDAHVIATQEVEFA